MNFVGIDIGSTSAKTVVMNEEKNIIFKSVLPTGWSSIETAKSIEKKLEELGITKNNSKCIATGYGRISVPYADKTYTEITCHGKGAAYIYEDDCTVIDIGGQDTKVINLEGGVVTDFIMNDKCSAGTGRFLEIMANTLGVTLNELSDLAREGKNVSISSMCTVFAESEVISLIGSGAKREDIAYGVIDSIASKVKSLCSRQGNLGKYYLTGGLCENDYILESLSQKLEVAVKAEPLGRYAGAIGAALLCKKLK